MNPASPVSRVVRVPGFVLAIAWRSYLDKLRTDPVVTKVSNQAHFGVRLASHHRHFLYRLCRFVNWSLIVFYIAIFESSVGLLSFDVLNSRP